MSLTPGPWKWFDYPDGRKLLCGPDRAVIHSPDAPMTCDPEDQSLIAAAPDLLAALTVDDIDQIIDGLDNFCIGPFENEELRSIWQPYIDKLKALRTAIEKVQG
jgi:hypothetical protein